MTRPWTTDSIRWFADGSAPMRTITTKRACNGCARILGDITRGEMNILCHGGELPDVRAECGCLPPAVCPATINPRPGMTLRCDRTAGHDQMEIEPDFVDDPRFHYDFHQDADWSYGNDQLWVNFRGGA